MKAEDARAKTDDELREDVLSLKKEAFNLRFQRATGQLENTARVREVRRDVATAIAAIGPDAEEAVGLLVAALGDDDPQVRARALRCAAQELLCARSTPLREPPKHGSSS